MDPFNASDDEHYARSEDAESSMAEPEEWQEDEDQEQADSNGDIDEFNEYEDNEIPEDEPSNYFFEYPPPPNDSADQVADGMTPFEHHYTEHHYYSHEEPVQHVYHDEPVQHVYHEEPI